MRVTWGAICAGHSIHAIHREVLRLVQVLIVAVATLTATGIPAAAAAEYDDCGEACADEALSGEANDCGDGQCPPLCHGCVCVSFFAQALVAAPSQLVTGGASAIVGVSHATRVPPSANLRGVFHPPRLAA